MADNRILPALPEPTLEGFEHELWGQNVTDDLYTASQMNEYACACVLLERKRWVEALTMTPSAIRLMAGEMTAQEMRTVQAILSGLRSING